MDLQEIRKELDVIDRQIVDLYEKRMKLCGDVAEYKISVGKPVYDGEREKQKLEAVRQMAGEEYRQGASELFTPADDHQQKAAVPPAGGAWADL